MKSNDHNTFYETFFDKMERLEVNLLHICTLIASKCPSLTILSQNVYKNFNIPLLFYFESKYKGVKLSNWGTCKRIHFSRIRKSRESCQDAPIYPKISYDYQG